MENYYTVMIVPGNNKRVKSFRIPSVFFKSFMVILVLLSILLGILLYNYWSILEQIHTNRQLGLENTQLREQIQLFQMKVNTLSQDVKRIRTFEKKLRIITGLSDNRLKELTVPFQPVNPKEDSKGLLPQRQEVILDELKPQSSTPPLNKNDEKELVRYISLYEEKIAAHLGLQKNHQFTRKWSANTEKSFELAKDYALFDYSFKKIKKVANNLEIQIHRLDQYLLDRQSILDSTPTIIPAVGWTTSYFGLRQSPHAKGIKMHEGLDIGGPYGTPIVAPADGIVTFAGIKAGFGNFIQIDHGYGLETIYAHAQKLVARVGDKVKRGQLIATVGNTGRSTGPHLHYEVRVNGIAVDPLYFVL